MAVRTTSKTVTFMHPFSLTGTDEVQPAGTYTVEELLEPSSFPAYRRVSTLMRLPARTTGTVLTQIVQVNPVELAGALVKRRAAGRNVAATGSQRRCRVFKKGAWPDGVLP
jgi:hypothetical protein